MVDLKFKPPATKDNVRQVPAKNFSSVVIVDVETTGLAYPSSEIIELAACDGHSDAEAFLVYINPVKEEISRFTTHLTQLMTVDGVLLKNLVPVPSEPVESALEKFVQFLEQKTKPIVLVAHKANFDVKFLLHYIRKCNLLERFTVCVVGFADIMEATRKKIPLNEKLPNYKLPTLYRYLTEAPAEGLHEAANDMVALRQIVPHVMPTNQDVSESSYNMAEFARFRGHCDEADYMSPLLCLKDVSSMTLYNMAKSGIRMDSLFSKASEGLDVFTAWFQESAPMIKPRLVVSIFEFFRDYVTLNDGDK
jgi:DNA polymerase III alpha subunit (gram-positive type)